MNLIYCYIIFVVGYGLSSVNVQASNILAFLPSETQSHFFGFTPLLKELVKKGHNLTLVSPYSLNNEFRNKYNYIHLEDSGFTKTINHMDKSSFVMKIINYIPSVIFILFGGPFISIKALDKDAVKNFIENDKSNFDLVIFENFFAESHVTLGHKYNAPVVQLVSANVNPRISQWHGNPYHPGYIPEVTSNFPTNMTFIQRTINVAYMLCSTWLNKMIYIPQQKNMMNSYFKYPGYENRPDLGDMLGSISLTVYMSHSIVSTVTPHVPSYIPMAGTHIAPNKELPENLKTIMENAKDGVVFFSLGSVIQSSKMSNESVSMFLSVLGKIKQTVLWKWEDDQLPNLPKNIIVRKWFPQNDILGHPNCKLFITHGGVLSIIESFHHSVPILCMSIFADQDQNCMQASLKGMALHIPFFEVTSQRLSNSLQRLINDPQFKNNALKNSAILKDTAISILDNVIYWIEYVIRHNGAQHLKTTANNHYWFQFLLLDVIVVCLLVLILILYINFKCLSYIFRKYTTRKVSYSDKLPKKNQ
ncbi:UDP-glycosyltransferase UGT5-like [Daktulosphaira vitifoliae]|uniref:UDP-glycosyltransferase UGT5-like n=1 Tax=Daktulosphaira vitifoliae TaxID=58002 RepID=UPI0021AA2F93|nr:UDP-glycosyltransferase UGT5-like [Daktulosphaira vitifoliae]